MTTIVENIVKNISENPTNTVSSEEVVEYLNSNLDFFDHQPDLLLSINSMSQSTGSTSLVERQLKGLRERISESQKELNGVVQNAQNNQYLLEQTIKLSLELIPCTTFSSLFDTLFKELRTSFDVSFSNLLLNDSKFSTDISNTVNLKNVIDGLGDNYPDKQPVCGRLKRSEKELLFKDYADVQSVAILPLGDDVELGLLALGSEDPRHFDPEMGDMFLIVISEILSQLLIRLNH